MGRTVQLRGNHVLTFLFRYKTYTNIPVNLRRSDWTSQMSRLSKDIPCLTFQRWTRRRMRKSTRTRHSQLTKLVKTCRTLFLASSKLVHVEQRKGRVISSVRQCQLWTHPKRTTKVCMICRVDFRCCSILFFFRKRRTGHSIRRRNPEVFANDFRL